MAMDEVWLVICNAPDAAAARTIAALVVETGAAACVNIMAPCESVYHWQGVVERALEVPMLIKTTRDKYAALEAMIRANHSHEVPEIIAVPLTAGFPAYMDWVRAEVVR
jgi:periplasmic divalent cation tolerance protein